MVEFTKYNDFRQDLTKDLFTVLRLSVFDFKSGGEEIHELKKSRTQDISAELISRAGIVVSFRNAGNFLCSRQVFRYGRSLGRAVYQQSV